MLQKFLKDESGATAIEYVLLAALIGVAIITAATTLGTELGNKLGDVTDELKKSKAVPGK
ncbi:MAG: Flp family type IVb pilin [Pseudomonadota bacterium]